MYQNAALRKHSSHHKWRIMLSCTELGPRERREETRSTKPDNTYVNINGERVLTNLMFKYTNMHWYICKCKFAHKDVDF